MPEITFNVPRVRLTAAGPGVNIDLTRGTGYCRCDSPECDAVIHVGGTPSGQASAEGGE